MIHIQTISKHNFWHIPSKSRMVTLPKLYFSVKLQSRQLQGVLVCYIIIYETSIYDIPLFSLKFQYWNDRKTSCASKKKKKNPKLCIVYQSLKMISIITFWFGDSRCMLFQNCKADNNRPPGKFFSLYNKKLLITLAVSLNMSIWDFDFHYFILKFGKLGKVEWNLVK